MPRIAGINPWLSIWRKPRNTIRVLLSKRPSYGVFILAAIFALQSFVFHASCWSLSLKSSNLLAIGVVLAPAAGFVWLYAASYLFYFTGRLFGGNGSLGSLKTVVAWSKVPSIVGVALWFPLSLINPDCVFIPKDGNPFVIFANVIFFTLAIWSLVILVQGIREVQRFTCLRALSNIAFVWVIGTLFFTISFALVRYFVVIR